MVFTVFLPENSGLRRFNDIAIQLLPKASTTMARGEEIPSLVSTLGGYGWTGKDLYNDYLASGKNGVKVITEVPWPEKISPRLCLLGPREAELSSYLPDLYSYFGKMRVAVPCKYLNLASTYSFQQDWAPTFVVLEGQVEKQIRQDVADLAIDIVYSGKTILEEKLKIYDTLFNQAGFVLLTKDI